MKTKILIKPCVDIKRIFRASYKTNQGFTLIELLVVISIIGLLSTIVLTSLNSARAKTRDAKRLSDMEQIQLALELYYADHGRYPEENPQDNTYEISYENSGDFINSLRTGGYFPSGVPVDPVNSGGRYYFYYLYPAGVWGNCDVSRGTYYMLGVSDLEVSGRPAIFSPALINDGCLAYTRRTQNDWTVGKFEN